MINLVALDSYQLSLNTVYVVGAPFTMSRDAPAIKGESVTINQKGSVVRGRVVGVEHRVPDRPIYYGEPIGLILALPGSPAL